MQENEDNSSQHASQGSLEEVGGIKFSPREIDTLSCILQGKSAKKIATLLSISPKTVDAHTRNIMLKLEVNSRERIIDFAEKSDQYPLLRNYYSHLVLQNVFDGKLKEIFGLLSKAHLTCVVVSTNREELVASFVSQLDRDLKRSGLTVHVQENDTLSLENQKGSIFLYVKTGKSSHKTKATSDDPSQKNTEVSDIHVFVKKIPGSKKPMSEDQREYIIFNQEKYYTSFFELLKFLYPNSEVETIFADFKRLTKGQVNVYPITSHKPPFLSKEVKIKKGPKHKIFIAIGFLAVFFTIGVGFFLLKGSQGHNENIQASASIRSDLLVPNETTILNRPSLLKKIDESLSNEGGIQTVVLVGLGGAGKTTLSRKYARSQKFPIIWEINAETNQSLFDSFEKLAQSLSVTDEDKKKFRDSRDSKEREERIIQLVREKLKISPHWLLIFDNVEKFADIQKYFPNDVALWGKGNVILTTRDSTIQNNDLVNHTINVGELEESEKYELFKNIIKKEDKQQFTQSQENEVKLFLKEIPPFPLDVSIAARYLKATNESYDKYLKSLLQFEKSFESTQENLLQETGNYTKTRRGIITLSLNHLMESPDDFTDLLLLISLFDSQNIPREVLDSLKNNVIVSNFIYNLKKQSLIMEDATNPSDRNSSISIHRSTQQISLDYLKKLLQLEKGNSHINIVVTFLYDYMSKLINDDDIPRMRNIAHHVDMFLSHNELLYEHQRADLLGKLGWIYVYLGDHEKGKSYLEQSLEKSLTLYGDNYLKTVRVMSNLGFTYGVMGNYEPAKILLEKSDSFYKVNSKNSHEAFENMLFLGNLYTSLADYKKAQKILETALSSIKKSKGDSHVDVANTLVQLGRLYLRIGLYKESINCIEDALTIYENQPINTDTYKSWALTYLGSVYGNIGQYEKGLKLSLEALDLNRKYYSNQNKAVGMSLITLGNIYRRLGKSEDALNCLKEGNQIYETIFGKDHTETAWSSFHLGNIYRLVGDFSNAKKNVERSLNIYKDNFGEDHINSGWALIYVGNLYKDLKEYPKAKESLIGALEIYTNYFGEEHTDTAGILRALGEINLHEGNTAQAEWFMKKAMVIYEKHQNPELCFTLLSLADLYQSKSVEVSKKGNTQESASIKKAAFEYLERALKIANDNFPEDSIHIQKIQAKIKEIKN